MSVSLPVCIFELQPKPPAGTRTVARIDTVKATINYNITLHSFYGVNENIQYLTIF